MVKSTHRFANKFAMLKRSRLSHTDVRARALTSGHKVRDERGAKGGRETGGRGDKIRR